MRLFDVQRCFFAKLWLLSILINLNVRIEVATPFCFTFKLSSFVFSVLEFFFLLLLQSVTQAVNEVVVSLGTSINRFHQPHILCSLLLFELICKLMLDRSLLYRWSLNRSTSLDRWYVQHSQIDVFRKVALNRFPSSIIEGVIKLSRGVDPSLSTSIHLGANGAV